MSSKVLTCQTLPYYHGKREKHWINAFKNKIDDNQDISVVLKDGGSQANYSLHSHYTNLLLYAITNKKTDSANSIFDYIDWNNNERLMEDFFFACSAYFKSDKYKGDASRIITFVKEKNILKDFLLNINYNDPLKSNIKKGVAEKLSSKNEGINQYLYDNEVIFSALLKQHKINKIKFLSYPTILALLGVSIMLVAFLSGVQGGSISRTFNEPVIISILCAASGVVLMLIAGNIWMYYAENNIPVEKMQKKLDEQNSQGTASIEDLEAEEQEPSTVLEIHAPPIKAPKWTLLDLLK